MSDVILIAGYYRSGTSALAGALQRLGVVLHNDAEANEHNPLGFYEIPELIELDIDIFKHLGVEWTDLRGLPDQWWERADIARFLTRLDEVLRRRFKGEALWGLKHPHLCRLFPLYERAVIQAGHKPHVIHMCRAPWTVAASQQRKNNLARAHAVLLWLTYLISAEKAARALPRSWLTYQELLADPAAEIARLEGDLGLTLARAPDGLAQARNFLTSQLNRSEPVASAGLFAPLQSLAEDVWHAVQARDAAPAAWDGFAARCADIVGFLTEIGTSRGVIVAGLTSGLPNVQVGMTAERAGLRPAERLDEGAKRRLLAMRDATPDLPSVHVVIAVPPGRAHAINDTLEALRGQWYQPAAVKIISAEPIEIAGHTTIIASAEPGDLTAALCAALNEAAQNADYVATINAGDVVAADACLRFALAAALARPAMIYCDETVQTDNGAWVRHKPGWDVTRLRQSAYIGDWVWYASDALRRAGGFDPAFGGAEEYELQLRMAELGAEILRLPEALFTRNPLSRRDNIPSTVFGARANNAVAAHLTRAGLPANVTPRRHLGLFSHQREMPDPGTTTILLCGGGELAMLDRWLKDLLTNHVQTGPIILAGGALNPQTETYLTKVAEQAEALQGQVLAVMPAAGQREAAALAAALAMVKTELVAVLDIRALPATPDWPAQLRARLADSRVVLAGARTLVQKAKEPGRFFVQGPIVIGADTRMGAGHFADDPGPGGWLLVDQEASAVAPGAVLARAHALTACVMPDLAADALWTDLCAQMRAAGGHIVWSPDISFVAGADSVRVDVHAEFRNGSTAAKTLSWEDPYHHPALSLHGDLLLPEPRLGLVRAGPADPHSVLLTGPADTGLALMNAARAVRAEGLVEASWSPEPSSAAEICRRAAAAWVRINPDSPAPHGAPDYAAVFTATPKPAAKTAIAQAQRVIATSPGLVKQLKTLAPRGQNVALWRPALYRPLWESLALGTGINTNPRVLWVDEGVAPDWLVQLMNETKDKIAWIIVERAGQTYTGGSVSTLKPPEHEQGWAQALGTLGPHIMIRPAERDADGDHYPALMAAAAGCVLLVDERWDIPGMLGAVALPNRLNAWQKALRKAIGDLPATLAQGQRTRAACLGLPSVESVPPPWDLAAPPPPASLIQRAAE